MLILSRYLKAVILATYLCSLSHLVENRHMSNSEDQNLEPQLDSLPSVAVRHQSGHRQPNNTSQQSSTHHKRRHKHNLIYNTNVDIISDLLINNLKSDKDNIFKTHHINNSSNNNNNNKHENLLTKSPRSSDNEHIPTSRQFFLLNRCSNHYISVFGTKVTARAKKGDPFALMSLETVGGNGIRIRSNTGQYICFNKIGKLVTRFSSNLSCRFTEEVTHSGRVKYRSSYNPDWYLGFHRKGGPIAGKILSQLEPKQQRRKIEKCQQFLKKAQQKPFIF